MAAGAPDWERIVTIEADVPSGTGAPDWERIVVGSGGVPIGGGTASGDWGPADYGVLGWTWNPFITQVGSQSLSLTSGMIRLALLKVGKTGTSAGVAIENEASGGLVANECYAGLYKPTFSGGLLSSASLVASTAAGVVEGTTFSGDLVYFAWASSLAVTAGSLLVFAMLVNYSGGLFEMAELPEFLPSLGVDAPTWGVLNVGWETTASTYTSLPSSLAAAALTAEPGSILGVIS